MPDLDVLTREELVARLTDAAKLWLAHDGLWFQAVERAHDMQHAIQLDAAAWERFTVIEARRIMARLGLAPGGGLDALARALDERLYALLNRQEVQRPDSRRLVFRMNNCRVQEARQRKGLPDFPCKPVGLVEYAGFARTIDERIETRCICCPPDDHPADYFCAWEFTLGA
jgi:hypothetical protein